MEPAVVGENIKRLRKAKGLSQKALAEQLNVIDKTISRWECGYGLPDVNLLPEIAKIFDVSIEELIGEEMKPQTQKPRTKKRLILISSCLLGIATAAGIAIPVALANVSKASPTLGQSCWSNAIKSKAAYSLFTAFGAEETMSLELDGDLRSGKFVCQESWMESEDGNLLNCLVYGQYQTEGNEIRFYADGVNDPNATEKLRSNTQLGIPYFAAQYEGEFGFIHFTATEKNTMNSAFGRWTKYMRYYSTEIGSIDFERILGGAFSESQLQRTPSFALVSMGQIIPVDLRVEFNDYPFYVGRVVDASAFKTYAIYSDGREEDVSDVAVYDLDGAILKPDDRLLSAEFSDGGFSVSAELAIEPKFPFPWDLVDGAKASSLYFTHYLTESIKAFGMIELYESGQFLYSEAYGKQSFASFAVLRGTYSQEEGHMRFTVEKTFTNKAKSDRFAASSAPYSCEIGEGGDYLSFETSAENRNFFGYFANTDGFDPSSTTSFSRHNGEIYCELVGQEGLSTRAKNAIAAYGSMIASSYQESHHEITLSK